MLINLIILNNKCLIILLFSFQLFKDVRIFLKEKKLKFIEFYLNYYKKFI